MKKAERKNRKTLFRITKNTAVYAVLPLQISALGLIIIKNDTAGETMQIYWEKTDENLNSAELHDAVYALLHRVLREEWSLDRADIRKTEAGKPYIAGSELKISVSHTRGLVCCAVSEHGEIGVDCEYARKIPDRVPARVCTERELSDIRRADDPDNCFLRYWTLKESISKKLGVGMRTSFKNFEILWDGEEPVCRGHKLQSKQIEGFFIAAAE